MRTELENLGGDCGTVGYLPVGEGDLERGFFLLRFGFPLVPARPRLRCGTGG